MQRYLNSQTLILGSCSLVVFYLAALPIGVLLYGSFRDAPIMVSGGSLMIQNYARAFFDPQAYVLGWNSVQFALGSAFFAFLIGTYLAWVNERTNVPLKRPLPLWRSCLC